MLHHVTLEVTAAGADRFAELLGAIGFAEVAPPAALSGGYRWFERDGTQVHLAVVAEPVVAAGRARRVRRGAARTGRSNGSPALGFEVERTAPALGCATGLGRGARTAIGSS